MATFYSSFFSSGLLAPLPPQSLDESPVTPRQHRRALDADITPTGTREPVDTHTAPALLPSITLAQATTGQDDGRPRLRRRKSSLTTAASPLAAIKSTTTIRNASASVQRQSLFTSRARSGSDASILPPQAEAEEPSKRHTIAGRLRSGSVGTSLRPKRTVRGRNTPPAPPPSAPLPALPPLMLGSSLAVAEPSAPRRPLTRRALTADNARASLASLISIPPSPAVPMDVDYVLPSSPGCLDPALASTGSNRAQIDYPSPIDGDAIMWGRDAAKEN